MWKYHISYQQAMRWWIKIFLSDHNIIGRHPIFINIITITITIVVINVTTIIIITIIAIIIINAIIIIINYCKQ